MKYIIVDLEMNPVAKEYKEERKVSCMEIIEIGAVIMDESFLVLGEFKTLVKPQYNDEIYKRFNEMMIEDMSTDFLDGDDDDYELELAGLDPDAFDF